MLVIPPLRGMDSESWPDASDTQHFRAIFSLLVLLCLQLSIRKVREDQKDGKRPKEAVDPINGEIVPRDTLQRRLFIGQFDFDGTLQTL